MVIRKKKQKNVEQGDAGSDQHGDCWIYTAIKSDTKLHLAHSIGKRVQETATKLIQTVRKCGKLLTHDDKATVLSDGNDQYATALLDIFEEDTINYGQIIKTRVNGRVVGKTKKVVLGVLDKGDIETVTVERYNLTLRHGISRLVRKTICFSKCRGMLENHLDIYQCYNNLIRTNSALTIKTPKGIRDIKRTSCMADNISKHPWTWMEFLMFNSQHPET